MSKPAIQLNDTVTNSTHGNGQVITANSMLLLNGQPVACEGDEVIYQDGTKKKILSGQACAMINGKKIALMGDGAEEEGTLESSQTILNIGEGEAFIFLNAQIDINNTILHFNT